MKSRKLKLWTILMTILLIIIIICNGSNGQWTMIIMKENQLMCENNVLTKLIYHNIIKAIIIIYVSRYVMKKRKWQ
jgi:hypothetical protein